MEKTIKTLETSIHEAIEQLQDVLETLQAVEREVDVQKDTALKSKPIGATQLQLKQLARIQVSCFVSATDIQLQIDRLKNVIKL